LRIQKKVIINTAQFKGRLPVRVKDLKKGVVEAVMDQVSAAALLTSSGMHITVEEAADLLNGSGIEGLQIIDENERIDSSWEAPTF
jgi:hypothetical protein